MQLAWMLPSVLFGMYLGVSTGAWHMLVMSLGSSLIWIIAKSFNESREIDLTEPVTFDGPEVWIGDYQLPKREIFWKKRWHQVVYSAYKAQGNQPVFQIDLALESQVGHALIIGATGSGKSELLKLLLSQMLQKAPDSEFVLIDFKGGATFGRLAGLAQVKSLTTDIDGHDPQVFWQTIQALVSQRESILATSGVSRIEDLAIAGVPMPRCYIFVDELVTALAEAALASTALNSIAARGRSLGVHLVAATQSSQGVPRVMLTNLRARIVLGDADPIELAQLNVKRPAGSEICPSGWASGILQKPGELSSHFNFPLGASFGL
jgi:S-DNA-T family DNA segregation ATPase FtsK/SpoIIIE